MLASAWPCLRVQWLPGALLLAAGARGLFDVEPRRLYDAANRIESACIYGNIDEYAYYYIDLLVGSPAQRVSVILDTGSGVCAFPCASCGHCGQHIDPAFDFAKSTTANWLPCGGGCTGSCTNGRCSYYQGYTEGSSISGFWFRDLVSLGDAFQRNPPVNARMGCHNNENNLFYTQKANGILGVGPNGRGGRTLLQELFEDHPHVSGSIFSICLAEWGGRLVVGGYNASYHTGTIKYVPLRTFTGYYGVPLSAMYLQGQLISASFGSAMIDSGTTYTYMGSGPYNALRNAIVSYCRNNNMCGARNSGTCWTLNGPEGLSSFPSVDVAFGEVRTVWVPKAYLYRRGSSLTWCYAFENDGPNANTVLGASWMLHQEIILDMQSNQVGIVPANCPEFRQRPAPGLVEVPQDITTTPAPTTMATTTITTPASTSTPSTTAQTTTEASTAAPTTTLAPSPSTVPTTTSSTPSASSTSTSTLQGHLAPGPAGAEAPTPAVGSPTAAPGEGGGTTTTPVPVTTSVAANRTVSGPVTVAFSTGRVAAAASAALALVGTCAWCAARRTCCCRRQHRYVKHPVDESGMPPQIVGSTGDFTPEADTFIIDDVEHWGEEDDGFDAADDKLMHAIGLPHGPPEHHAALHAEAPGRAGANGNAHHEAPGQHVHHTNGHDLTGSLAFPSGSGDGDLRRAADSALD